MKSFVAVVGAGQVGATTAQRLIEKNIADVVLLDVVEGLAEGKALDLMEAAPIEGHSRRVVGTSRFEDIRGAAIVVITAGLARKPGMTREDLLAANAKIVRSICEGVKTSAPNAVVITVTNPLDIMTQLTLKLTGFPRQKVMGMAGVLDSARMRYFVSEKAGCEPRDVSAMVLGGHGDLMVPVMSRLRIEQKPAFSLGAEDARAIIRRTRDGGAEIVSLLKTGSAFYAPASSVAEMVSAVISDRRDLIFPACAYCTGEYGIRDVYCGVPVRLGREGIVEIVELALSDEEKAALRRSADAVRKGVEELEALKIGV